jgi:hypothetical protein
MNVTSVALGARALPVLMGVALVVGCGSRTISSGFDLPDGATADERLRATLAAAPAPAAGPAPAAEVVSQAELARRMAENEDFGGLVSVDQKPKTLSAFFPDP